MRREDKIKVEMPRLEPYRHEGRTGRYGKGDGE